MDVGLAVGVLDDWNALGKDIATFLTATVLVLMYLASVARVWGSTHSPLKAGATAAGGAIVLAIIASQTVLSTRVEEEIKKDHTANSAVVVRIEGAGGGLR